MGRPREEAFCQGVRVAYIGFEVEVKEVSCFSKSVFEGTLKGAFFFLRATSTPQAISPQSTRSKTPPTLEAVAMISVEVDEEAWEFPEVRRVTLDGVEENEGVLESVP